MLPFIDAGEAFLRATALLLRGRFSNLAPCFQKVTFKYTKRFESLDVNVSFKSDCLFQQFCSRKIRQGTWFLLTRTQYKNA